ncbi:MAG TPA: hypothetical protein VJS67_17300 [Pseudonocardiaceae bacterium]|nr:hypothetical protein [Pseudonocardiaceae bacterium]
MKKELSNSVGAEAARRSGREEGVRAPPLHLIRRLATVRPQDQFTTSITVGELIYGARQLLLPKQPAGQQAVMRRLRP